MFGVPLDGPCNVFYDNETIVKSTMRTETTLKKKTHINYLPPSQESGYQRHHIDLLKNSRSNHANLFTKVLNHIDRKQLMGYIYGKSSIPG